MRIQIEPTEMLVEVNDVQARVWNGITEGGTQVFVFVYRLAVRANEDVLAFENELIAMPELRVTPIKELLGEKA